MDVIGNPLTGDRVLVTLQSNVVRSAVYLGIAPGPVNRNREGFLLSLTPGGEVVEWVDMEYVKKLEVTFTGGDRR